MYFYLKKVRQTLLIKQVLHKFIDAENYQAGTLAYACVFLDCRTEEKFVFFFSVSRLNVIFSKFDEVQRSGNMVLSPMSGKITFPVIFRFFFFSPKLDADWVW